MLTHTGIESITRENALSEPDFMACYVSAVLFSVEPVDNEQQQTLTFLLPKGRSYNAYCKQFATYSDHFAFCSVARRYKHFFH